MLEDKLGKQNRTLKAVILEDEPGSSGGGSNKDAMVPHTMVGATVALDGTAMEQDGCSVPTKAHE